MKKTCTILFLFLSFALQAQLRIVSYNVENLFDTRHDSLKLDEDYTPEGKYHWTISRYNRKLENLSRVLVNISRWDNSAVIGLCEVENEQCLKDLLNIGGLKKFGYKYIHQESSDQRGIDCTLLYDPQQFNLLNYRFIHVPMPENDRPTRDIVYACGIIKFNVQGRTLADTLHIMMCHLPSQLGGTTQTAHKRVIAHNVLQNTIDSIKNITHEARIIIMGDMNSQPTDNLNGMQNLMLPMEEKSKGNAGTHKWQGSWSYLDQFYISHSLHDRATAYVFSEDWIMEKDERYGGYMPMRCYQYTTWKPGYSDHLPIYIDIKE